MVTGFGRSISEVGAVRLVGGNIKGRTRTMMTTTRLLKSQGIFTGRSGRGSPASGGWHSIAVDMRI